MKNRVLLALFTLGFIGCNTKIQKELPIDIAKETQVRIDKEYHLGTVSNNLNKNSNIKENSQTYSSSINQL